MYGYFKRLVDFILAFLILCAIWPLYLIIALLIRIESPGPVIFKQWRVGQGHRLFRLYKFRTMDVDSEKDAKYLSEEDDLFCQVHDDPRITRIGRFLRKLSFDELPQFFNILRGDMSLIGPRPLILSESNRLPPVALHRLDIRPGLTGFAQAEGRSNASPVDRFAHDLYYVRHYHFLLDVKIALMTLRILVLRKDVI